MKLKIKKDYSLEETKNKADQLRTGLGSDNPILAVINPYGNVSVSSLFNEYVLEREIPCRMETYSDRRLVSYPTGDYYYRDQWWETYEIEKRIYPSNPDEYLKPLDIVKVKNEKKGVNYFHFAVYLGKGKVSHITSDNQGVKVESWNNFLDGTAGELVSYRPVIPFKKWDDAIRHIAKATVGHYKKGEYNLCNDNCEHYAWEQITGIDYSKQAIERPSGASFVDFLKGRGNHGVIYWTSVNLQSMIRNSNQKFDSLRSSDNYQIKDKIREIKGSEDEWQARTEVPAKNWL